MGQGLTDTAIQYAGGKGINGRQLCHGGGHQHQNGEKRKVFQAIGMCVFYAVQQARIIGMAHTAWPIRQLLKFLKEVEMMLSMMWRESRIPAA